MSLSWLRIRTVVRRNFVVLWRSPHRWFDLTVWPLVDVVVWGALGAFVAQENDASRAGTPYLLAGIMLFHVLYQSQIAVTTGFMEETWTRNLLNLMTTPLREVEYAIGLGLYGLAKLGLGMTAVVVTALVFFGFNLAEVGWALVPIALVLLIVAWSGSQFVIGLMLRYGQSAEILAWGVLFVIMALSGVFNPVEAIPGPLQPIARVLPTTHAFAAARTVLDGEPLPWGEIAAGLVGAAVAAAAGLAYVIRMLAVFRRRGYVTRFS
ncbi:MAG TPA: ABC transporter permease [Acidimicrobiales bacterium]|nr:ABC transporter permease [Acidimicrobiales bacterium]